MKRCWHFWRIRKNRQISRHLSSDGKWYCMKCCPDCKNEDVAQAWGGAVEMKHCWHFWRKRHLAITKWHCDKCCDNDAGYWPRYVK